MCGEIMAKKTATSNQSFRTLSPASLLLDQRAELSGKPSKHMQILGKLY